MHASFLKDERINISYPGDMKSVEINLTGEKEKIENDQLEGRNIEVFRTFCEDEKVTCHVEKNVSLE